MIRLVLRLSLGMGLVLAASLLVLRWAALTTTRRHMEEGLPKIVDLIDYSRRQLEAVPRAELPQKLASVQAHVPYPLRLHRIDQLSLPARGRERLRAGLLAASHARRESWTIFVPLRGGTHAVILGPIGRSDLVRAFPLGLVSAAIVGIVALAGFLLAWPLARRLRLLEQAAQRISEGELCARAEVTSPDAVGRLAARFNIMADRVQALLESQEQLVQAVSHELRTPTARIRFGLEMLSLAQNEEERARRAAAIDEDLTELDDLVGELLLYVRCGKASPPPALAALEIRQEAQALAARLGEVHPELRISIAGEESFTVRADRRLFRRALQNVMANACRYARTQVTLHLERVADTITVAVSDDGPGVPAAERQRIFEPFTRVDDSRSRESGGAGLGLAIVKRIMELHQGSIAVSAAEDGGACFTLSWPAATERYTA